MPLEQAAMASPVFAVLPETQLRVALVRPRIDGRRCREYRAKPVTTYHVIDTRTGERLYALADGVEALRVASELSAA